MDEKALRNREAKKKRKPKFLRSDWHKRSRIGRGRKKKQKWRKPKGRHNKIREQRKGKQKRPEIGYGSPRAIKATINGLKPIYVSTINQLEKLSKEDIANSIAIISSNLGLKKRLEIFNKAKQLGIKTNLPENFSQIAEEKIKERKLKREAFEKKLKEKEEKKKEEMEKKEEREKEEKEEKKAEIAEVEKEIKKEEEEAKKVPIEKVKDVSTKSLEKKGVGYHRQALEK